MVLLTNTTITSVLQTQRKSGMFAFQWLMVEQCLHHHYIGGTVPVPPCSKLKKWVSISNRAGAAVFAAPIICLVCTVLVHFSSYNNTQQLQIYSPPPWADRRKSQRDVFYLGRPIAHIWWGEGGAGGSPTWLANLLKYIVMVLQTWRILKNNGAANILQHQY